MRNRARFANSRQHLTHQFITTTLPYQEEEEIFNYDFRLCLGDDVTQNVCSARETQLFLVEDDR